MSENKQKNIEKTNKYSKIILLFLLLFMLLLNIFDFLNKLVGDIDFIEKLLSWSLFGYLFYQASLTKIFIGTRKRIYDLIYILAFALISITKSLHYYTQDNFKSENYLIFKSFLETILNINETSLLIYTFFLGIILIIINSIILLKNTQIQQNSLLGSINFNSFANFIKLQYITLILISIFFATVLFNFFMEWFALAIDDFLPIIGLFYYLFKYVHIHTKNKFSSYLENVNNSGQNFFENVIEKFSNKKTILIGISFLLTLHLVVDAGVYMFPYTTGIDNGLYFNSLDLEKNIHIPIINLHEIENSRIYNDLNLNSDLILDLTISLIYLISIITLFSLLILPFYIYYKNIQKQEIIINNKFAIILFSGLIFLPIISFLPNINLPLNIDFPDPNSKVTGVDIYTQQIITESSNSKNIIELLSVSILFLIIMIFLLFRYEKYKFFFDKIILIYSISFFLIYIFIFYLSTTNSDYNHIINNLKSQTIKDDTLKYNEYILIYQNETYFKRVVKTETNYQITAFTTTHKITERYLNYSPNQSHQDFFLVTQTLDPNNRYRIKANLSNIYFKTPQNIKNDILYPNKNEITLIYKLSENSFNYTNNPSGYTLNEVPNIDLIFGKKSKLNQILLDIIIYTKFLLLSIFYIFGSLEFAIYFTRKNILHTT